MSMESPRCTQNWSKLIDNPPKGPKGQDLQQPSPPWMDMHPPADYVSKEIEIPFGDTGMLLGADVLSMDGTTLKIIRLHGGGIIDDWNARSSADQQVKIGDEIIKADGIVGNAMDMLAEIRAQQVSTISVRRIGYTDFLTAPPPDYVAYPRPMVVNAQAPPDVMWQAPARQTPVFSDADQLKIKATLMTSLGF